ncbi:MAG: S49 family peptidase [Cohaesibacteraceae bacterium]|nr:S49 family peptidase [Cohaesibacteraceae bacterium]
MAFWKNLIPAKLRKHKVTIPVVRLHGAIGTGGNFRSGLSLASSVDCLTRAFSFKDSPAVALSINSPGGSPVQSRLIFQRIRQLAADKNKLVLVFCEDVAASGGYMIALAGDEVYADPTSIIGSIGVVASGFGFEKAIEKLGIDRRVYTSGSNKAVLDPFLPENQKDIDHLLELQKEVHEIFIDMVKSRRGDNLSDNEELFTGQFWTGQTALQLGLVDGLSDMRAELQARYGDDVELKLISQKQGLMSKLNLFGSQMDPVLGSLSPKNLLGTLEERALWSRFGI